MCVLWKVIYLCVHLADAASPSVHRTPSAAAVTNGVRDFGPGRRWFELRQDRLQGCQPRRKRIAVFVDGAPEKLGQGGRLVIGKVERHDGVIWHRAPLSLRLCAKFRCATKGSIRGTTSRPGRISCAGWRSPLATCSARARSRRSAADARCDGALDPSRFRGIGRDADRQLGTCSHFVRTTVCS
jgi:hypothetical protein